MNNKLKLLMFSDIFVVTGMGLIDPIIAVFIKDNLIGGSLFSIGIASTIFLITKSVVQLPFAKFIDRHEHKLRWLIIGTFMIVVVPFIYIFANHIYIIYLAQFLHGIGSGLAYPTWLGLWSANLSKKKRSYHWSIYSTTTGLGTAGAAATGSALAQFIGFQWTFVIVGIMSLIGCIILFGLEKKETHKQTKLTSFHK